MKIDLTQFKNALIKDDTAVMRIDGGIGTDVIGTSFVSELHALANAGFKEVEIRINSFGGSVLDGYSIFSAILSSGMKITTICDGIAASTASWILLAGDVVKIYDYAKVMIHNPSNGNGDQSPKAQEVLSLVKDTIVTIISKRTGNEYKKVSQLMDTEKWFTSNEAKEFGFVSEIVETGKIVTETENLSYKELFNVYNTLIMEDTTKDITLTENEIPAHNHGAVENEDIIVDGGSAESTESVVENTDSVLNEELPSKGKTVTYNLVIKNDLVKDVKEKVIEALNAVMSDIKIDREITEEDVEVSEVENTESVIEEVVNEETPEIQPEKEIEPVAEVEAKVDEEKEDLVKVNAELLKRVSELEAQTNELIQKETLRVKQEQDKINHELVQNAINAGKIEETSKGTWMNLLNIDFITGKKSLESIKTNVVNKASVNINQMIKEQVPTSVITNKSMRDLEKENPAELLRIKTEEPENYRELYKNSYGKYPF